MSSKIGWANRKGRGFFPFELCNAHVHVPGDARPCSRYMPAAPSIHAHLHVLDRVLRGRFHTGAVARASEQRQTPS
eukprot:6881663-Prymnesium_polylepis.1